jgi:hypothetical protein
MPGWARVLFATIGMFFLLPAGLLSAWGVAGLFGAPSWDKGVLLANGGALFFPAVACFFMALRREPRTRWTASVARKEQEQPRSENEGGPHTRDVAGRDSGEPNQLVELTGPSLAGQGAKQGDHSRAEDEPKDSEKPPWVSWFLWGSLVGVVFGAAGGAKIGAGLAEGRVVSFLLGTIGAVIGAPIGLFIGQIVGVLLGEILGLIGSLILLVFIIALLPFRRR